MNTVATGLVLIPGVVALLVFLVFTYLHEQSRQNYFRAWQIAWAAYTLHYALEAVGHYRGVTAWVVFFWSMVLGVMGVCIFFFARLMGAPFLWSLYYGGVGLCWAGFPVLNL